MTIFVSKTELYAIHQSRSVYVDRPGERVCHHLKIHYSPLSKVLPYYN